MVSVHLTVHLFVLQSPPVNQPVVQTCVSCLVGGIHTASKVTGSELHRSQSLYKRTAILVQHIFGQ